MTTTDINTNDDFGLVRFVLDQLVQIRRRNRGWRVSRQRRDLVIVTDEKDALAPAILCTCNGRWPWNTAIDGRDIGKRISGRIDRSAPDFHGIGAAKQQLPARHR